MLGTYRAMKLRIAIIASCLLLVVTCCNPIPFMLTEMGEITEEECRACYYAFGKLFGVEVMALVVFWLIFWPTLVRPRVKPIDKE